ncbi:MAG: NDP-sugar synthase [Candidatus Aerophobetes bacterium]|nr:NDP-sugar synthase [Candidatus Aerophobetes bacterium]
MLLAAGVGTRLRPLTYKIPKPIIPVINKPSISYPLKLLKEFGINKVVINLYHSRERIKRCLNEKNRFGLEIEYSEEEHLLGTAGGVKKMEKCFNRGTFLVLSADGITNLNINKALKFHREKKTIATVVLKEKEEKFKYGIALRDKEMRITQFIEKPNWGEVFSNTVNTGIYIFEPEVLSYIPPDREYDFGHELLPFLVKEKEKVYGYLMSDYWIDMGNLEDYRRVQIDILGGKTGIDIKGNEAGEGLWLGENSEISPSSIIETPVVIGNNCRLEKGAKIGKFTVLGDRVTVKKRASLERCILWNDILIGKEAKLKDCILTDFTSIPPGLLMSEGVVMGKKQD